MVKGLRLFDIGTVIEGAKKIGPILLKEMKDKTWNETVDLMKSLSKNDFELFKNVFFDDMGKDNEEIRKQ